MINDNDNNENVSFDVTHAKPYAADCELASSSVVSPTSDSIPALNENLICYQVVGAIIVTHHGAGT